MDPLEQPTAAPGPPQFGDQNLIPDPLPPVVAASDRFHSVTAAPRRVKAGPMAAAVATVAILAVSAVPSLRSASTPISGGPVAPAAVVAELVAQQLDSLPSLGPLRLDGVFSDAVLVPLTELDGEPGLAWIDRADGSASLRVQLVSSSDPSTRLEGRLDFRGLVPTQDLDHERRGLFVATLGPNPSQPAPALERIDLITGRSATSYDARARAYSVLSGELVGTGRWSGVILSVVSVPGSSVRRGPWADSDRIIDDTVFARILWLSTQGAGGSGSQAVNVADHGHGEIALALVL